MVYENPWRAVKTQGQDGGYTRRHGFVQSCELTLRNRRALARIHKAWRWQRVRYGAAAEERL